MHHTSSFSPASARRGATRFLVLGLGLAGVAGCGSDGGDTSAAAGGAACENGRRPASSLIPATNAEFCESVAAALPDEVTCAYEIESCGVPLKAPPGELARSPNVKEFSGSGAPKIGCYAPDGYPPEPGASATVTVVGEAKIFSHGCESKNLTIEFWTVKRGGGADDGAPNALVGTAVTTPDDCEVGGVESDKDENCSTTSGKPWHCKFSYPDIPTETELLVKTSGDVWAPLYEYNVFVPASAAASGMYEKDVRALATDDYNLISQVAIGGPITPKHGAVAGEVHDCDDVRLVNAVVDVDVDKKILTYFSSDEDHPLPVTTASGSSTLALYAAIDVLPGPVAVSAVALVNGTPTTVGFFRAQVFPDSVTSVTFRGLRPFQVP